MGTHRVTLQLPSSADLSQAGRRDKLLRILSETSVSSQWVEQEVETALEEERKREKTVLFPVRLDDTVFSVDKGWP